MHEWGEVRQKKTKLILIPYYLCTTHCTAHSNAHYTLFIPEKKCSSQTLHLEGHHPLGSAPRERERGEKKHKSKKTHKYLIPINFLAENQKLHVTCLMPTLNSVRP